MSDFRDPDTGVPWGTSHPLPVTGSTVDGGNVALGATTDAAASSDTGTFSLIALFKRLLSKTPALGIAAPAASIPVTSLTATVATGQAVIAVTGTQVQLSAGSKPATNGIVVVNQAATAVTVGATGVTNTVNGTGNGFILGPGASQGFAYTDANLLYVNGTAGSIVTYTVS